MSTEVDTTGAASGGAAAPGAGPGEVDIARVGRRLQLTRAAQWFAGNQQDPYGLILRAGAADPEPLEERVRELGPLFRSDLLDTWVTTDRAVAETVVADEAFGALTSDGELPAARELPLAGTALATDPAAHARLAEEARAHGQPLWEQDGAALGDLARRAADRLPTAASDDGFDLAEYARRLSAHVTGASLGVPAALLPRFETALVGCRRAPDALLCPQVLADARAGAAADAALRAVLGEALAGREQLPGAVDAACALAVAAAEPAAVLLGNAVRELLARPAQWAALTADPGLAGTAVTETLRWAPPVRLESRVARRAATLAGRDLPAGARVVVLVAAVNRDGAEVTGPGFDICRGGTGGEGAFGLSPDLHFGLSAPVIQRTAEAGLTVLATRHPGLRPAGPVAHHRRSPVLRSYAELPVATQPHPPSASASASASAQEGRR